MKKLWLRFNWNLFLVIVFWVFAALLAYTLVGWLQADEKYAWFSRERFLINWRESDPDKIRESSLKLVGGIGAIVYLVIKYRERSDAERGDAESKLVAAVQQLGDKDSPAARIAGVYSLTEVADRYGADFHQRVVDVLCGYLRSERGYWQDRNKRRIVGGRPNGVNDNRYISTDGAVESTIIAVLRDNCAKNKTKGWHNCKIDLHNASFSEEVDLREIKCKKLKISQAYFGAKARFDGIEVEQYINVSTAYFRKGAFFANVDLSQTTQYCSFKGSKFRGAFNFSGTKFPTGLKSKIDIFEHARFNISYRSKVVEGPYLPHIDGTVQGTLPPGSCWYNFKTNRRINILWNRP